MKKVLVGGCFDVLHYGHIQFLEQAKKLGDTLIVILESDKSVKRMKGEYRPIHTQAQRNKMLTALKFVDDVINLDFLTADREYLAIIKTISPNVIAITQGDAMESKKRDHAKAVGAEIAVIPKIETPSTSQLAKLLGLE